MVLRDHRMSPCTHEVHSLILDKLAQYGMHQQIDIRMSRG